jgi:hypothetical protein
MTQLPCRRIGKRTNDDKGLVLNYTANTVNCVLKLNFSKVAFAVWLACNHNH